MKIFSTFQELWAYCLFCPICQEPSRTITISIGPDDDWRLTDFQKVGSELKLFCYWTPYEYSTIFTIDCDNNTYQQNINSTSSMMINHVVSALVYIYMHAKCHGCNNTYLDTMDIEFQCYCAPQTISNFQIEREGVYLLSEKDKFHISLQHDRNVMSVSRMFEALKPSDGMIEEDKVIDLPLVNLDFSNVPKIINKIKTFILFS